MSAYLFLDTLNESESTYQLGGPNHHGEVATRNKAVLLEKFLRSLNANIRKAVYKEKPRSFCDAATPLWISDFTQTLKKIE